MRNISFALTTPQFIDGTKDVTRRMGWATLGPSDVLCAVEKSQGLKKGKSVKRLGLIMVKSVRREKLNAMLSDVHYGNIECVREGFPDWSPRRFVDFFCASHHCNLHDIVTRIEFERIANP